MRSEFVSNWTQALTGHRLLDLDLRRRLQQMWATGQNSIELWSVGGDIAEGTLYIVLFAWTAISEKGPVRACGLFEALRVLTVPPQNIKTETVLVDIDRDAALAIFKKAGVGVVAFGTGPKILAAEPVRTSA